MNAQLGEGPTVNLMQSNATEEHKSTITARKGAAKKPGVCLAIRNFFMCVSYICVLVGEKRWTRSYEGENKLC